MACALRGCRWMLRAAGGGGIESMDVIGARAMRGPRRVQITGYSASSFTVDDVSIKNAVLVFPQFALVWKVRSQKDITRDSLIALELFNPKPQTLIIGTGAHGSKLDPRVFSHLRATGISFEMMDTQTALSTFNVLNAELRNVVAALLPADCIS
mmetsp:Transcript_16678/g.36265  ORF Transcript_16678/g.36265 Transcript_16678/m.36265 type:complete len:154 (+) Transcript_16678:15-476(+)